jgi:hypothetical protein
MSLHDAIYCTASVVDHVYSTIIAEYAQRGMTPQVKVKELIEPIFSALTPDFKAA